MKVATSINGIFSASLKITAQEFAKMAIPGILVYITGNHVLYTMRKKLYSHKTDADTRKQIAIIEAKTKADMELYKYKEECRKASEEKTDDSNPDVDNAPLDPITTYSYDDMMKNDVPLEWIVEPLIAKGMVNYILGCAGVGKSLVLVASAISSRHGERAEYAPTGTSTPVKFNAIFYRTEEFPGEYQGKYGEGYFLKNSGVEWRSKSKMKDFSLDGLLKELASFAQTLDKDTIFCIDTINKLPGYDHRKFIRGIEDVQKIARDRNLVLTFIVAAHYDEIEPHKPLYAKDIVGGDGLIQEAGSVFAIRKERTSPDSRFIQVLKEAKGSRFNTNEVLVAHIEKRTIDEKNWYTRLVYDTMKQMNEALPLKVKADSDDESDGKEKNPKSSTIEWTDDMLERLAEHTKDGLCKSEIARRLMDEFKELLGDQKLRGNQVGRKQVELGIKPE